MAFVCLVVKVSTDQLNDSQLSLLTDKNFDISVQSIQSKKSDHSSNSEAEEAEQQGVFEVRESIVKTGLKKGKIEKKVVLCIGRHTFKKWRQLRNGNLIFTCNGCEAQKH